MRNSPFSSDYQNAKARFLAAANHLGAQVDSYALEQDEELTIDVVTIGDDAWNTIVISSGVHGVEGFPGSAIQLALLERLANDSAIECRFVLIHAVNPFGFANLRRFNEDNVDLNRNFLLPSENYAGSPEGYARLNGFLNKKSPPSRYESFRLSALWNIARFGFESLKQSIALGQYDFPRGIFFGGHEPCQSTRIIQQHAEQWLAGAGRVTHLDIHSGLGKFGSYTLLVDSAVDPIHDPELWSWYASTFGHRVEPMQSSGTAYRVSGLFVNWMKRRFDRLDYRSVGVEFGTYDAIRVLSSICAENRAHHYAERESDSFHRAKRELLECFCPADPTWRERVVSQGLQVVEQARNGLTDHRSI